MENTRTVECGVPPVKSARNRSCKNCGEWLVVNDGDTEITCHNCGQKHKIWWDGPKLKAV